MVTFEDFLKIEMRVGRVISAEGFPEARKPAYKMRVDFGEFGVKSTSAQITKRYKPEELVGRLVVAVTNFPPKRIAGFKSEILILGAVDKDGDVVLLRPDFEVKPGLRIL